MTSWDFFDTLCGRRTGHAPWRLFDWVAGEEYRRVRQLAEARSDKTWAGIWKTLAEITGWPAARVNELEAREWAAEKAAAFPIVENVRKVQPGDRIVSDCYFTAEQVRELADLIGIPGSVDIVTSWDGKWAGHWWATPQAGAADVHVGDNRRSDFSKPLHAGIAARLYSGSQPSKHETAVEASGRWEVAAAMRAARLSNPYDSGDAGQAHWLSASQANVRFLIFAAAIVRQCVEAARPRRVLFASRDALLLREAYAAAYSDLEVGTFWVSRQTLRRPSRSYAEYVRSVTDCAMVVDLHGTGSSVREFVQATGIELAYAFVCGQRKLPAVYPRLVELRGINTGTAVEVMNYDNNGRVVDVVDGQPVRAPVEYDLGIVERHRAASLVGVRGCCRPPSSATCDDVAQAAESIRSSVSRDLLRQHQVHHS